MVDKIWPSFNCVSSNVVTTSHNSTNRVIPQQIGEIVDYGAAGAAPMTEGYVKSGANTTNPIINLQQKSILFNGQSYPSDSPYHFDFTINTGVTATNYDDDVNDIYRAYKDYVNCYTSDDRCGKLLRFNEWVFQPVFCFRTSDILPTSSTENTSFVNVYYRSSNVNQIYMYAAALFCG